METNNQKFIGELRTHLNSEAGHATTTKATSMARTKKMGKGTLLLLGVVITSAILVTAALIPYIFQANVTMNVEGKDIKARMTVDGQSPTAWTTMPADLTGSINVISGMEIWIYFDIQNNCYDDLKFDISNVTILPDMVGITMSIMDEGMTQHITELTVPNHTSGQFVVVLNFDPWLETQAYTLKAHVPVGTVV